MKVIGIHNTIENRIFFIFMLPAEVSGTEQTKTDPAKKLWNPAAPDPEHWLEEICMCLYSVHIVQ